MNALVWLGSARYTHPLDDTQRAKWRLLAQALPRSIIVTGFAASPTTPLHFVEEGVMFRLLRPARMSMARYGQYYTQMPLLLGELLRQHDRLTLVAQSPFEGVVGASLRQRHPQRVRLVIENHNNFEIDLFLQRRVPLRPVVQRAMKAMARFAFAQADATRAVSTTTEERCRFYAPHAPCVRFMTWSDTAAFTQVERAMPAAQAVDIVYAGVLRPGKGVHVLIEAFARLAHPAARLLLIGEPQNTDYSAQLQAQADALGISERMLFIGKVPQTALAAHLAAARVMVLPSFSEGLPRVVVEAMLTGTPVIATRVGGIPELICEGKTGWLVPPDDVGALCDALRTVYGHREYDRIAQAARAFALDYFSPQHYVDGYRELLDAAER